MIELKTSGLTKEEAIVLGNVGSASAGSQEIYKIVDELFGQGDGSYFIHSETTSEEKRTGKNYRILLIEDGNGRKGQLWFDISNWS